MAEEQRSNKEGYSDPTADAAVAKVDKERKRAHDSDRDRQGKNQLKRRDNE